MRAKTRIEEIRKEREAIIVSEIPYQINKATLVERIAELVREKKVEAFPTCATSLIAMACGLLSRSSAMLWPMWC